MNHRTYDGQCYSPLDKINKGNVKGLRLAYAVALGGGAGNEFTNATPLAEDGFRIVATDKETGKIVWESSFQDTPDVTFAPGATCHQRGGGRAPARSRSSAKDKIERLPPKRQPLQPDLGWISRPPLPTREVHMLDHIGLRTTQFDGLVRFYETALAPLGYTKLFAWEGSAAMVPPRCSAPPSPSICRGGGTGGIIW
jgi:hypothetical protein